MCDYDYSWQSIGMRRSKTRKPHECVACLHDYPAGVLMTRFTGLWEGEFQSTYNCETCQFLAYQDEDSPLHVCAGDVPCGGDDGRVYDYARMCLEEGLEPIATVAQMMRDGWVAEQLEEVSP